MVRYTDKNGNEILLGTELGKGGEASVYTVSGKSNLVAKIYNSSHTIDKQKLEKLEVMCDLYDDKIAEYYAWPLQVIYSGRKAVGFIMENLNSSSKNSNGSKYEKFVNFYGWKFRRKYFPNAEYRFMVHAAQNLAVAIQTLHEKDIVVGDINESNVFVNNTDTTIKLIDCDSYQIEEYLCDVGKPEYTAPELPNKLRGEKRTANHDNFALAVMIFLILVGKHPYTGLGAPLDQIRQSITQGLYCYGKDAKKKNISAQYPYSEVFNSLNDEIKELFEQAFCTISRPTAKDWINALGKYEKELVECANDKGHWYNPNYNSCIWCDLENDNYYAFGNAPTQVKKIKHNYSKQTPYQSSFRRPVQTQTQTTQQYNTTNYNSYSGIPATYTQQQVPKMNPALKYFVIIALVIFSAGVLSSLLPESDSSRNTSNNSTNTNYSSNTTNSQNNYNYPSCDADNVLKPMKQDRTARLKPLLENSQYVLNANYSLWYRNTTSEGNGYCRSEEMIKNLFWADPNVYLVHPINYRTSYRNGSAYTEHSGYDDFDSLIYNSEFYSGNRKLSQSEIDSLLQKSLP